MDSVSQIALGAALGELVLGRHIGRRAVVLGAVLGTLPDLDVLVPYADAVDSFTRHRSWSHSVFVLTAASLPLAALAKGLVGRRGVKRSPSLVGAPAGRGAPPGSGGARSEPDEHSPGFARWWLCVWLVLVTHPLLDSFTVYGTQLWWPLPVRPVAIGSVFIIDPLYTIPLLVGVVLAWRRREASGRRANRIGLALSTGYLGLTLLVQDRVEDIVRASLASGGGTTEAAADGSARWLVAPLPLSLLWRVVAVEGDTYAEGWYSLLDEERKIDLTTHERGGALLEASEGFAQAERLRWFTGGFVRARERDGELVMTDLRIGAEASYVFAFALGERDARDRWHPIVARELVPEIDLATLGPILRRVTDERALDPP